MFLQRISGLSEEDEDKQDLLERLDRAVAFMSFPQLGTQQQKLYSVTYEKYLLKKYVIPFH